MEKKISKTIAEVPSPHADAARAFLDRIRALPQDIPRFTFDNKVESRQLASMKAIPDSFLETAGVILDRFERIALAVNTDAATVRDSFSYALAYDPIVRELNAFSRGVAHTIRVQRSDAVKHALDVYAIARRLSQQKDGAELIPYVEDMQKKLAAARGPKGRVSAPAVDTNTPK